MTFYHGSSLGGLTELKPFMSEHGKPYIYFSTNPVVALLYSVRPVPKPFSWYPYGFDGDTVVYSEYYPNAFADIYKGKKGFLYECDHVTDTENPTNINCAYTCEKPVSINRITEIEDVYTAFMEYISRGLFRIKTFNNVSAKELDMVYDDLSNTIKEHDLLSIPDCQMSIFIKNHFNEIWKHSMVIADHNDFTDVQSITEAERSMT